MTTFTDIEKRKLLEVALEAFRIQRKMKFNPEDFDISIEKPDWRSKVALVLYTKRQDDHFRIKLYVTGFSNYTFIDRYKLMSEQNFPPGPQDEVQVAYAVLDKNGFKGLAKYLYSNQFKEEVLNASFKLLLEEGDGFVLTEQFGTIRHQ